MKGSRIHGIVRELKNENIDVINYTANINLLIQRSLTPAKITSMDIDQDRKHAEVYLITNSNLDEALRLVELANQHMPTKEGELLRQTIVKKKDRS